MMIYIFKFVLNFGMTLQNKFNKIVIKFNNIKIKYKYVNIYKGEETFFIDCRINTLLNNISKEIFQEVRKLIIIKFKKPEEV